jgi:hypothetical protein
MSKEMLGEKLNGVQGPGPESVLIVTETKKGKREGLRAVLLVAAGIGILVMASILLLPYVNSLRGSLPGGMSSTTTDSVSGALEVTGTLEPSFKAIDAAGNEIEENGVTKSDGITITGYSDSEYDPRLQCSIDSLYIYCSDGMSIGMDGLHAGKHTFTTIEHSSGETIVRDFSWNIIAS